MDYFGVSSPSFQRKLDSLKVPQNSFNDDSSPLGNALDKANALNKAYFSKYSFGDAVGVRMKCQSRYCQNLQGEYKHSQALMENTVYLPYCDEEKECLRKNISYLLNSC